MTAAPERRVSDRATIYVAVVGPGQTGRAAGTGQAVAARASVAPEPPAAAEPSVAPEARVASEPSDAVLTAAEEVGAELASGGAFLVCGGLGGVMEAACRGAIRLGGQTIGLLPGRDRADGNSYLSVSLPTGLGELRNALVVAVSDAVIAVGGSWGTLSEIALAVRTGKPTVVLGPLGWQIDYPGDGYVLASTPREAVEQALQAVAGAPNTP